MKNSELHAYYRQQLTEAASQGASYLLLTVNGMAEGITNNTDYTDAQCGRCLRCLFEEYRTVRSALLSTL